MYPAKYPAKPIAASRASLFRSGLSARLTLAAGLCALVWTGIIWALVA